MTNILNKINSLFPISDDTVQVLKENVTCCRFPKKYQLIKADTYCKSAFFIEKGITRSFWLVDGLGKNHSSKRIQAFASQPQRPFDLVGKGTIRSVQGTISGRISASELRIYSFLPGYQTFYTQQAPGKRIIEFDIGQIFYPQKRILLPHITNI